MTAQTPSPPFHPDPSAVVEDWDALLRAVSTKLRLLVGDPPATEPLRSGVLECAAALEQVLLLIREQMPAVAPGAARRRRCDNDDPRDDPRDDLRNDPRNDPRIDLRNDPRNDPREDPREDPRDQ